MSRSLIATLLAERSADELEALRSKLENDRAELAKEAARVEFELQQLEEALDRKTRPKGGAKVRRRVPSSSGPSAFKQVRDFIRSQEGNVTPAEANAALRARGFTGSNSAIYNSFRRLLEDGTIEKLDDGVYRMASRNGDSAANGATETGDHEPLSMAT